MPILTCAVVFVGLLCLLDLLLTLAVIRRLRAHTEQLASLAGPTANNPLAGMLAVGSPLPAFAGHSIDGAEVGSAGARPELIGFLSTGCSACSEQLPALVDLINSDGIDRAAAVVVVAGPDSAESRRFVAALAPVATVVREQFDGAIMKAFAVEVYPTFYLVADGTVRESSVSVGRLVELRSPARQD